MNAPKTKGEKSHAQHTHTYTHADSHTLLLMAHPIGTPHYKSLTVSLKIGGRLFPHRE